MTLTIRPAVAADLPLIYKFICDLADYEKLRHEVRADVAMLGQHLFGPAPKAEVLIGEIDRNAQGFALFFHNFSTFEGKPGLYLEDLFVLALERGCARLEWWVLDWNASAIAFYKSLGARPMDEWTVNRVDGAALAALASG
jgi:hypothetical protein